MNVHWLGWMLSAIVLILLVFICLFLKRPATLMLTGKRTEGVVTGIVKKGVLLSPVVQFISSNGKKVEVSSKNYSTTISIKLGEKVTLLYNPANPADAQLLMWREFTIVGFLLIFILVVLLLWISGLLVDPTAGLDDPLHVLSSIIILFKLTPWRLPLFFLLFCAIFSTGLGAYVNFKSSLELRADGIRVAGRVTETKWAGKRGQNGAFYTNAAFAMISYMDLSRTTYSTRRSLAKPLSRLQKGDVVEVIYPPGNPAMGIVNTWDELFALPSFFAFMFFVFIAMLLLLLCGVIKLPSA